MCKKDADGDKRLGLDDALACNEQADCVCYADCLFGPDATGNFAQMQQRFKFALNSCDSKNKCVCSTDQNYLKIMQEKIASAVNEVE